MILRFYDCTSGIYIHILSKQIQMKALEPEKQKLLNQVDLQELC